ncbi:MAG: 2-dehydro-3-deoxygalactonokinase, partial [Desulfobacterales bacterium]|nr:2-dehydro-3-deoxygalactonokinase [Desulfobacterales bacterium]
MPQIIALDWGTTSLRAWCLDEGGNVLHFRSGGDGITQISDHNFENELYRMVGEWMDQYPEAILMACGMIGSRNGWSEVPYALCPAGKKELVDGLEVLPLKGGRSLYLIPGVCLDESLRTDIMRGEETQIIGALKGWREGVAVLPGTHCKWAKVKDGEITSFSTYLTGELFAAIKKATLIGTMVHESIDMAAFTQSVERAISGDAGV